MVNIAIVTDTSADLTPEQATGAGISLVPLSVSFGDETFQAVTELSNDDFYPRLTAPDAQLPRTAAPNPAQFEAAYREALDGGADGVVCLTLSSKLSATYSSAVAGAESFDPGQVVVIDAKTTTHSQAMIAMQLAEQAAGGATMEQLALLADELIDRSDLYFAVATLEYLQKGGRIGRASALVGTMLSIKPILRVVDGEVTSADRRRTAAKARARLLELVTAEPVASATVVHTLAPDIERFRDDFAAAAGLDPADVPIGLVGPVAGTHVGPGLYGVSLILAE